MPWDSSSWVWGNLIETWCQPFAIIGNILLHLTPQFGIRECKKRTWCWKRGTNCGFGDSACSIFFSAELFLRGVSLSTHTHSTQMCPPGCGGAPLFSHIMQAGEIMPWSCKVQIIQQKQPAIRKIKIPIMVTIMKTLSHSQSLVATIQIILATLEVQSKKWHFLFSNPLFAKNQHRMKTEVQTAVFRIHLFGGLILLKKLNPEVKYHK